MINKIRYCIGFVIGLILGPRIALIYYLKKAKDSGE